MCCILTLGLYDVIYDTYNLFVTSVFFNNSELKFQFKIFCVHTFLFNASKNTTIFLNKTCSVWRVKSEYMAHKSIVKLINNPLD